MHAYNAMGSVVESLSCSAFWAQQDGSRPLHGVSGYRIRSHARAAAGAVRSSFVGREARLSYAVVRRDLSVSMYPALLLMTSAMAVSSSPSVGRIVATLSKGVLFFAFHIYCFCLSNQIVGVAEDRINKPDRPLVSGMLDLPGAWRRWILAMVLFPLVGLAVGGMRVAVWALLWEITLVGYNFLGMDRHWFNKNVVFITACVIILLVPAWLLAAPSEDVPWTWIVIIALSFGVTLNLQDMRDVEGDRRMQRKTLPIHVGETAARWITAASVGVIMPAAIHFTIAATTLPAALWEASMLALNLFVAVRLLLRRSAAEDHTTYKVHTYWFCLAPMSPGVLHLIARLG